MFAVVNPSDSSDLELMIGLHARRSHDCTRAREFSRADGLVHDSSPLHGPYGHELNESTLAKLDIVGVAGCCKVERKK